MQIMIDIPEESFNAIKNGCFAFDNDINDLFHWIANGTPLPKGHGRLKDVDSIFNEGFPKADINAEYEENKEKYPYWRTDITGIQTILKNAPTIIEADKTESGGGMTNGILDRS